MDRWTQTELFVHVAEMGSLSKAAEKMGLSNGAASRQLMELERRLSVRLVERTTRRLWLTEAGESYLKCCNSMLGIMREGEAELQGSVTEPSGLLRVTCSVSFAIAEISPALPAFRERYPGLRVEVVAANHFPNFVEAGIDVAVRTVESEPDSGMTVRLLARTRRVMCAAPAYLAARGVPMTLEELSTHDVLVYTPAGDARELSAVYEGETHAVKITGILQSNDGQVLRTAALAGHGIVVHTPPFVLQDDIATGRLIPILPNWEFPELSINVAFQSSRFLPAKVRAFVDFMVERFQGKSTV